jgi:hypothetical protein
MPPKDFLGKGAQGQRAKKPQGDPPLPGLLDRCLGNASGGSISHQQEFCVLGQDLLGPSLAAPGKDLLPEAEAQLFQGLLGFGCCPEERAIGKERTAVPTRSRGRRRRETHCLSGANHEGIKQKIDRTSLSLGPGDSLQIVVHKLLHSRWS